MSFVRKNGQPNIIPYAKAASTAFTRDSVVAFNGSGLLVPATATTNPSAIAGIIQRDVLASDFDYAQTSMVAVEAPRNDEDMFYATVSTGSATQALVGTRVDLTDANGVNVTAVVKLPVFVEQVISPTKITVSFPGFNAQ